MLHLTYTQCCTHCFKYTYAMNVNDCKQHSLLTIFNINFTTTFNIYVIRSS